MELRVIGDGISDLVGWLAALQGPRDTPDPGGFPVEQALVSDCCWMDQPDRSSLGIFRMRHLN